MGVGVGVVITWYMGPVRPGVFGIDNYVKGSVAGK